MTSRTPAHSEGHSTVYTPDPSTMVSSANASPSHMTQDLPLCAVDSSSGDFPEPPVHVTLPTPARTTTRQKSPTPPNQSALTPEGQQLPLAIDDFFGPVPQLPRPVDPEKQEPEPRNIFAREQEPETVAKYLFYYGFVCPPFWLLGSLMLCIAPRSPSDSRPTSTEIGPNSNPRSRRPTQGGARHGGRLRSLHMQVAERRWSRRCLYAWVTFVICVVGLIIGLWAGRVGAFADR